MAATCPCSTDPNPLVDKTHAYRVKNREPQFLFRGVSCSHRSVFSSHTTSTIKSVTLPLRTRTSCTKPQWRTTLTVRLVFITHYNDITSRFFACGHLSTTALVSFPTVPSRVFSMSAHLSTFRSLVSSISQMDMNNQENSTALNIGLTTITPTSVSASASGTAKASSTGSNTAGAASNGGVALGISTLASVTVTLFAVIFLSQIYCLIEEII